MRARAFSDRLWRFGRSETGGTTVFAMMTFVLLLAFAAMAVDSANLFRNRAQMQITADAAAHAGAVMLARGGGPSAALRESLVAVELNMPEARFGHLVDQTDHDIRALHYDPVSGHLSAEGQANAVMVHLQRSRGIGNAVPTLLLGMFGKASLNLETSSVVALLAPRQCSNAEGIYAHGRITLDANAVIGAGLCLHSQESMELPISTTLAEGAQVSLPDLSGCGGDCDPARNAQFNATLAEVNMIMPETRTYIRQLAEGFLRSDIHLPEEAAFFATRPLTGDLSALGEVALQDNGLHTGDVVEMSPIAFSQMRERPEGLVYLVQCKEKGIQSDDIWESTLTLIGDGEGPALHNLALITNCILDMDASTRIEGALILSLSSGVMPLHADEGASLGRRDQRCRRGMSTTLMSLGDLQIPASLIGSDLALIAGGNVLLDANSRSDMIAVSKQNMGLVIHAGGQVEIRGAQSFESCARLDDPVLPALRVISYVMPSLKGLTSPLQDRAPETAMPGTAVDRLPSTAGVKDEGLKKSSPPEPEPGS